MKGRIACIWLILGFLAFSANSQAQPGQRENARYIDSLASLMADIPEKLIKVEDNIYTISPEGVAGNITMMIGEDGVYLVDSQWAVLSERIRQLVRSITSKPIKTIINTHFHFDHSNGNIGFGREKVRIVAHVNARSRMMTRQVIRSHENEVQLPYPTHALPTVTFTDKLNLQDGAETIEVIHLKNAHTDGDAVVHFKQPDVYHTGDIFVTYGLPIIDEDAGGTIFGMIEAIDSLLARADNKTRFVPGHGPICFKENLLAYRNLLSFIEQKVGDLHRAGKSLAEIIKETKAGIDPNVSGVDKDRFIEQVYRMVKLK